MPMTWNPVTRVQAPAPDEAEPEWTPDPELTPDEAAAWLEAWSDSCTGITTYCCDICDVDWTEVQEYPCNIFEEIPAPGAVLDLGAWCRRCPDCVRMVGAEDACTCQVCSVPLRPPALRMAVFCITGAQ